MSTPEEPQKDPQSSEPTQARAAHAHDEDDGPQPGNVAAPAHNDDDDDGPAPGNEKFPTARVKQNQPHQRGGQAQRAQRVTGTSGQQGQGQPGQQPGQAPGGVKKRRRKKRGGQHGEARPQDAQHAPHPHDDQHQQGEVAATDASHAPADGEHAQAGSTAGSTKAGEHGKEGRGKDRGKRRREHRPDRERAFNFGDVVFGKITEVADDAVFIDLSGKGRAIFDRHEMLLPDDEPGEVTEHAEAAAEAGAEAAAEAGAEAEAEAVAEAGAEAGAVAEAEEEKAEAVESKRESVARAPNGAQLPPIVLEVGANFVGIVHNDGGRGGLVVLTRHPRRASKAKQAVSAALKDKSTVNGLVTGVIKGGVEVDIDGLRAFAPASHVTLRFGGGLGPLVGKRLPFHVTQYGQRGRDVVVSRKSMLEAEASSGREAALSKLVVGTNVEGVVRSVVDFGAFVDLGGIEGLVALAEMSHNRSDSPRDVFTQGETIEVKILKIDDRGKIWLSRKAVLPDPWAEIVQKYAVGTHHTAKVARIRPFGVFMDLETGIDGLIHTADLVFPERAAGMKQVEDPNEVVKVGDEFEVVVAHMDAAGHRIGLHPALTGEMAKEPAQKVQQYKIVKAVVAAVEQSGLVMRILGMTGRNARGYISGAATGTARGTELRKPFPVGHQLEAKILEVDPKRAEVRLSIKALNDETERNAYQQYRQQVNREAKFTFGDLLQKKMQQQKN